MGIGSAIIARLAESSAIKVSNSGDSITALERATPRCITVIITVALLEASCTLSCIWFVLDIGYYLRSKRLFEPVVM